MTSRLGTGISQNFFFSEDTFSHRIVRVEIEHFHNLVKLNIIIEFICTSRCFYTKENSNYALKIANKIGFFRTLLICGIKTFNMTFVRQLTRL